MYEEKSFPIHNKMVSTWHQEFGCFIALTQGGRRYWINEIFQTPEKYKYTERDGKDNGFIEGILRDHLENILKGNCYIDRKTVQLHILYLILMMKATTATKSKICW